MRSLLVVGIAAFALLAGCTDEPTTDDATLEQPLEDVVELAWTNETVTGEVTSVGTPVASANPSGFTGDAAVWTFAVPQNTTELALDFAGSAMAPTTEVELQVYPAGCDMALEGSDCQSEVVTEGLVANMTFDAPASGTWQFRLFVENGADQVAFELAVAALAPSNDASA